MLFACPRLFVTIYVPQNKSIHIENHAGDITMNQILANKIEATSRNGDLLIENVTAESIDFGTALGSTTLRDSQVSLITMGTENGVCYLINVTASRNITVEVGTGNLMVSNVSLVNDHTHFSSRVFNGDTIIDNIAQGSFDLSTTRGNIQTYVFHDFKGQFKLAGPVVNIIPLMSNVEYRVKKDMVKEGTINAGGKSVIKCTTKEGSISIQC
jgi:DUF4097 and DUF4098 domain-containing protein YvlB